MPPRRRGKPWNGPDNSTEEVFDIISIGDTSDSSVVMAGKTQSPRAKGKAPKINQDIVPGIYQEMLAEALPMQSDMPERPIKRRRTGRRDDPVPITDPGKSSYGDSYDVDEEDDVQFEDVLSLGGRGSGDDSNTNGFNPSSKRQQTMYRDSDNESGESDFDWEDFDFGSKLQGDEPTGDLELTLTNKLISEPLTSATRRKAVTNAERAFRLEIHRMHVLCLLSHVNQRNNWCNEFEVQMSLKPLLDKKMLNFLHPKSDLSQFGRAESLKRGLEQVSAMWRAKFTIATRGIRRSLWANDEQDLKNFHLPADADPPIEKSDFRAAATQLKGSRDLGAQLYCALIRSAGLSARLVCSLQPLSFNASGPAMPRSSVPEPKIAAPEISDEGEAVDIRGANSPFANMDNPSSPMLPFTARRRLGHPNAADYHVPDIAPPTHPPPRPKPPAIIRESQYPVFWIEVLDEAHQKWFPVDPLVTETVAKPRSFEPPATDRENLMAYVIAFEDEGSARDVTRRYAKAYNAKTRKNHVISTSGGEKWWKRALRAYSRGWTSDLDQIEDMELAGAEAREPMPKNVADFKDHPYYALERHLKRHQVLASTHEIGKVAAGRDNSTPGRKKLESVYRRRDVKIAKSADSWYRLGREVKVGEVPIKTVAVKRKADKSDFNGQNSDGNVEERAGTNLYTEDQTDLYEAPPIVNGRVPKNSFGNLDCFVPSMIPKGGVHILHESASRAARILGIDYADALTGFEFRGRHGTAVLKGIIVAIEYREAVEAVIQGLLDEQVQAEQEARTLVVLRMWKRFFVGLRIKERVDMYEVEGEEREVVRSEFEDDDEDDGKGMESEEYIDDGAGGFFPE